MPRRLRVATGGLVYHVLNRAVGRARIFEKPEDYAAFERVLRASFDWLPMRLLAYCSCPIIGTWSSGRAAPLSLGLSQNYWTRRCTTADN